MTKKALEAVPATPETGRAANKKARQDRRDAIQVRWNVRVAKTMYAEERAKHEFIYETVAALFHFAPWVTVRELLAGEDPRVLSIIAESLVRIIQLKEMPYDEYLSTVEWQRIAKKAKAKYNGRCALDASHPAEHAHHRTYERRGREYDSDVIPLCADCHAKFHGKTPR